jgi:hypothetical protein
VTDAFDLEQFPIGLVAKVAQVVEVLDRLATIDGAVAAR